MMFGALALSFLCLCLLQLHSPPYLPLSPPLHPPPHCSVCVSLNPCLSLHLVLSPAFQPLRPPRTTDPPAPATPPTTGGSNDLPEWALHMVPCPQRQQMSQEVGGLAFSTPPFLRIPSPGAPRPHGRPQETP